jgi:hypothetical protein
MATFSLSSLHVRKTRVLCILFASLNDKLLKILVPNDSVEVTLQVRFPSV